MSEDSVINNPRLTANIRQGFVHVIEKYQGAAIPRISCIVY